jgi:protein MBA1
MFSSRTSAVHLTNSHPSGDTHTLGALACEGLNSNLSSRVSSRPKHSTYSWTLHRYIGTPRVVSQRAAILPIDDGTGNKTAVRQCVVRIKSVQSLRRTDARATPEESAGKEQEVLEYVVVQRRVWKGIEERWKLWGTTMETRLEDWEKTMNPEIEEGNAQEPQPSQQRATLNIANSTA